MTATTYDDTDWERAIDARWADFRPVPEVDPDAERAARFTAVMSRLGPGAEPGISWAGVDLAEVLAGGYEPPAPTIGLVDGGTPLFYPCAINSVFGDSGGGKTWLGLMVSAQVLAAGETVLLVDYESSPAETTSRLVRLGVDPTAIVERLIYVRPTEAWGPAPWEALERTLAGRVPALAIIDSIGEAMAADGVGQNHDDEVARWFQALPSWLAAQGVAVVTLDHVPKPQQGGRSVDFGIGSHRKRAAVSGAAFYLHVVRAPARSQAGEFHLITRKDRGGHHVHGAPACSVVMVDADGGERIEWAVRHLEVLAPKPTDPRLAGLSPATARVAAVLRAHHERWLGCWEVGDVLAEDGLPLKPDTIRKAGRELVSAGVAERQGNGGPGSASTWRYIPAEGEELPESDPS